MNSHRGKPLRTPNWWLVLPSILVLAVCVFFTYGGAYVAPYPGLDWGVDWTVVAIEPCEASPAWCEANRNTLQVGDQMLVVGDLEHSEYLRDRTKATFGGYDADDAVPITFRRDGEERTVDWQMLGPTVASRVRRLVDSVLLSIPFWLSGTFILLLLRPRDLRWWLLVLFDYVTAMWLAAGAHSYRGVFYASPIQHALAWLWAPIYLHLHLTVPSSLFRRWRWFWAVYVVAGVLAVLEVFQVLPGTTYYLGPLVAFLGSLGLLIFRLLFRGPSDKPAVRLMLVGVGLALGPAIVLWIVPALLGTSLPSGLTIYALAFAIPLLPFLYIYAIYKRQLGVLEFRANRALSTYSFYLLYVLAFVLVFFVGSQWFGSSGDSLIVGLVVSGAFAIAALPLGSRFQRLIDRLAYGARHEPGDVIRVFASRIITTQDHDALAHLLINEVMPSLFVRESALLLLTGDAAVKCIYVCGVGEEELPQTSHQARMLLEEAGEYRPPLDESQGVFDWVRLAVPLELRGTVIGVWLFGRRDPDDYYPQRDVDLLGLLAGQVAASVENMRLYAEQQRRAEEAGLLLEISNAINSTLKRNPILKEVSIRAARACQANRCTIFLLDEEGEMLRPVMSQMASGKVDLELWERFKECAPWQVADMPRLAKVLSERRPLYLPDARDSTAPRGWVEPFAVGSVLLVPLVSRERVVGMMALDHPEIGKPFTDAQVDLAVTIGGQAAVAIENARLHRETQDYARQLERRVEERTFQLQSQYAWLEAILRSSTDAIIVSDVQGEIIETNPVAEAWLTKALSPEDAARLREAVRILSIQVAVDPEAAERPETMLELPGLDLQLNASPIVEPGREGAAVVVAGHDVSHLRALDRMKSRFVSDVSHELRTPITTIKLYAALMQKASPDKMGQYLEMLSEEADRQARLVEDILQISRIDAGRLEMSPQRISLNELGELIVANHMAVAGERGLNLRYQPTEPAPMVLADPDRLMQVLSNLVTNAINYTSSGGEVVLSTAREDVDGRTWAKAVVTDTGMGIPEEELGQVFDRFFRGEQPRLMQMPGTGLGLAIVKEIVELHGGQVTVESRLGEGSTFTIWLAHA
jgi:signal transduction histidine kinase